MDRKQRQEKQRNRTVTRLNDQARALDRIMQNAGINQRDREPFMQWVVDSLWKAFKTERMNKRIEIENEIRMTGLRLPNGTVKKEYAATLNLPVDKISGIELLGAEALGLELTVGKDGVCTLTGTPVTAGDFTLKLRFRTVEGEPASEFSLPIAFNPDPRDLWKDIPTDPNIPYFKPDSDVEFILVEPKRMMAASRRGRSHAQEGKARDDHFSLMHCQDSGWYVAAVADGAGSARFSRKGSEVACNAVIDHCRALLCSNPGFEQAVRDYNAERENKEKRTLLTRHVIDIVYNGALRAHEAVKQTALANEGSRLKDFATTLMFVICKKFEFGWFIASFWVGDGAVCLFDERNHTARLLGTPDEGEFSGQTRFLTMPEIFHDREAVAKRLRMTIVDDFTALMLMTDGVSDPMFETDRNLNDYTRWKEFYTTLTTGFPGDEIGGVDLAGNSPEAADQLLRWLDFWSPGNHDDRTIALIY